MAFNLCIHGALWALQADVCVGVEASASLLSLTSKSGYCYLKILCQTAAWQTTNTLMHLINLKGPRLHLRIYTRGSAQTVRTHLTVKFRMHARAFGCYHSVDVVATTTENRQNIPTAHYVTRIRNKLLTMHRGKKKKKNLGETKQSVLITLK